MHAIIHAMHMSLYIVAYMSLDTAGKRPCENSRCYESHKPAHDASKRHQAREWRAFRLLEHNTSQLAVSAASGVFLDVLAVGCGLVVCDVPRQGRRCGPLLHVSVRRRLVAEPLEANIAEAICSLASSSRPVPCHVDASTVSPCDCIEILGSHAMYWSIGQTN